MVKIEKHENTDSMSYERKFNLRQALSVQITSPDEVQVLKTEQSERKRERGGNRESVSVIY